MTDLLAGLGLSPGLLDTLRLDLLARLLLAALLGGLIGLERELSGKAAGLRTNLLICVGAMLLTDLSIDVALRANVANVQSGTAFRADPARIAAQIVSGIGFLGAGTILQARGEIVGLTTAATIWVVAAIGMAVGADAYALAIGSTTLVLVALLVLGRLEDYIMRRRGTHRYRILVDDASALNDVEELFARAGLRVGTEAVEKEEDGFALVLSVFGPLQRQHRVLREVISRPGVRKAVRQF